MLNFRQIEFKKKEFEIVTLFHPPYVYWFMLFVFGSILLVAVSILLSNPFKKIASAMQETDVGGESSSGVHYQDMQSSPQVDIQIPSAELPAMERLDGDTQIPFSFLQNKHIRDLGFLLKDSPPEEVAIVASYLAPEMATKLLEHFSEEKQAEIALNLSGEGKVKLKEVKELEGSIKERLNYIVGGDEKLASIFDFTGEDIRKRIFDIMASTDAEAVSRLMEKVKSFKVVMRNLPPHGIQALFRQIDPTILARVLKSSPGDIQSQVLESLSEGAAERLREEMELSRPFSKERLKQERVNIISLVRRMSMAGLLEDMS
jgi:flagellar motor switch protein FliG